MPFNLDFTLPKSFNIDEKELLALISEGNEAAFKKLYELYRVRFYAVVYKMTGSDEVAEDIVQDIFLKIWKKRASLVDIENPSSYFFTAVYRRVYQYYRKVALEKKFHRLQQVEENAGNTTAETVLVRESRQLLSKAVAQLPPQQQMVYKLSKEAGYSREDIAEHLNISPNTVKNHLARAMKFVQAYLKDFVVTIFIFIRFWE